MSQRLEAASRVVEPDGRKTCLRSQLGSDGRRPPERPAVLAGEHQIGAITCRTPGDTMMPCVSWCWRPSRPCCRRSGPAVFPVALRVPITEGPRTSVICWTTNSHRPADACRRPAAGGASWRAGRRPPVVGQHRAWQIGRNRRVHTKVLGSWPTTHGLSTPNNLSLRRSAGFWRAQASTTWMTLAQRPSAMSRRRSEGSEEMRAEHQTSFRGRHTTYRGRRSRIRSVHSRAAV
jgi:hypothetical protein